jgi:hypothetical protein
MNNKDKISFADLAHQVVQNSLEPLPFNEILYRVQAIHPITTKNPKQTIRGAISQSRLIVPTGDGRYGWKPRLINGSVLRLTLSEDDFSREAVEISEEVRDSLWPTFFEIQKRSDRSPVHLELPAGQITDVALVHLKERDWGMHSPELHHWLLSLHPRTADHLIVRVMDGEAKRYAVTFESRATRDETTIAARNQSVVQAAVDFLRKRSYNAPIWDTTAHLLATGQYKHPIPPDPLSEIYTEDVWGPIVEEKEARGGWSWTHTGPEADDLVSQLFAFIEKRASSAANSYDVDNPPDLPSEYQPGPNRRARPSRKAQTDRVKTYTLRVNHRALPKVWRDIEIAEDQNLEDLHLTIQQAYDWMDDHLYSFFMSGKEHDRSSEIGSPGSESNRHTHQMTIESLELIPEKKFLYLFDYGDNHEFDVTVLSINPQASKGKYPKIIAKQGKAPPQYPNYDEETGEPEWDPYAHWR